MAHVPVLTREVLEFLHPQRGEIYVDGTIGNGGHAKVIGERLGKSGHLIGIDEDTSALETAERNLSELECDVHLIHGNARNIPSILHRLGIERVDTILLDLGLRSDQIDSSGRGFTFKKDEPLLMTFNPENSDLTARQIVNEWDKENIEAILSGYGEERYASRIADAIVSFREESPIETTTQLQEIISEAVPSRYRHGRINPATRTFQALRIAVNDEIEALREALQGGWEKLDSEGRFAVISFHSLEDRIVKHFFKQNENANVLTKKPIQPNTDEIENNPRSRSAKLRVAQKNEEI